MKDNWSGPWFGMFMLAIEAQQVIMLRMMHFATGGPTVQAEASRMITEKIEALADWHWMAMGAALRGDPELGAERVLGMYRHRVRANRARLSRM